LGAGNSHHQQAATKFPGDQDAQEKHTTTKVQKKKLREVTRKTFSDHAGTN